MPEPVEEISKKSALNSVQEELGAQFDQYYGWEMAKCYSSLAGEHAAVRTNAGLVDLTYCGAISVWGSEAVQFLNGLVSNDVKTLAPGKGMRAGFLTGHGKVRALSRVLNLGEEFLVVTDPQTHEKVFKYIFPFTYAGDFKVEDRSAQHCLLSVQGPKAHLILKEVCFEPVPALEEHDSFRTLIAGHQALVVRALHTGENGFDLFIPETALKDVWDFILLKGNFHSLVPIGLDALEYLRTEAGIPVYGTDVDESNMLLELGLADLVSFNKGCYTGQEAVAMATYRGHISKKLSGLAIGSDIIPKRGAVVRKDGKEIGIVTTALRSLSLGSVVALAYLKYEFFQIGTAVHIDSASETLPALVVELPFYRNPNK